MNSALKTQLRVQIQAYMVKKPNAELREVRNWLEIDNKLLDGIQYNRKTLKSFVNYQINKFRTGSDVTKHRGGNGRPTITKRKENQILRLALNKDNTGLRPVGKRVGVSFKTVQRVLRKNGAKPYHKYKTQKLTDQHKARRAVFANWMLKNFGSARSNQNLGFLINTDFSAKIKINPSRNSKNDVVWALSRDAASDKLESKEEKYSVGDMIWGGVSWRGLVPSHKPVFMSDFFKNYDPVPKSVNGNMYADLVRDYAVPAVNQLYPEGSACWQDDPATIHRCQVALTAVSESFNKRLDHTQQCPKFSDVWPIENVWGIVKERVAKKRCENLVQLKREITKVWRDINADKPLLRRLMSSIPERCRAVIQSRGDQIQ